LLNFFVFLLVGLLIAVGAVVVTTLYMLTHPPRRTYGSAVARGRPGDPDEVPVSWGGAAPFQSWTLESRGIRMPVWDVQGREPDGPVAVLTHGWGDSRIGGLARMEPFVRCCSRVLLWDMAGHGEAGGRCTLGTREVDDLCELLGRLGEKDRVVDVVLYGWSLGAGVSLCAAARLLRESDGSEAGAKAGAETRTGVVVRGVVLEAPYRLAATPAGNVIGAKGMPVRPTLAIALAILNAWVRGELTPSRFDRALAAQCLRAESRAATVVACVHGEQDAVSPIADSESIAAAAGGQLHRVKGRHHGLWTDTESRERLVEIVNEFVARAVLPR
jgi:pimeloyl-ACP methyl ester carboxylesterase